MQYLSISINPKTNCISVPTPYLVPLTPQQTTAAHVIYNNICLNIHFTKYLKKKTTCSHTNYEDIYIYISNSARRYNQEETVSGKYTY